MSTQEVFTQTEPDQGVICDSCESYTEKYVIREGMNLCEWCG